MFANNDPASTRRLETRFSLVVDFIEFLLRLLKFPMGCILYSVIFLRLSFFFVTFLDTVTRMRNRAVFAQCNLSVLPRKFLCVFGASTHEPNLPSLVRLNLAFQVEEKFSLIAPFVSKSFSRDKQEIQFIDA